MLQPHMVHMLTEIMGGGAVQYSNTSFTREFIVLLNWMAPNTFITSGTKLLIHLSPTPVNSSSGQTKFINI